MSETGVDVAVVLVDLAGGGTQKVVLRLVNRWVADGRRACLIAPRTHDGRWDRLDDRVERVVLDAPIAADTMTRGRRLVGQLGGMWRLLRTTRRAVRDSGAPVVLSLLTGSNLLTLVACVGLGRRVVISERNDTTLQRFSLPVRLARRLLYRRAAVVTANSTIGVRGMTGYVRESKLRVVTNGVELPDTLAETGTGRVVLAVGRLAEHKEHALLVEAFAALGRRANGWQLRIVGDGPQRQALEALVAERRLADRVALTGHLDDVAGEYLGAGVFVLPSRYEGTPNALLEAMAHGLACVVSSSLTGALEYVEDRETGRVFGGGQVDRLTTVLADLIADDAQRVALGRAARRRVERESETEIQRQWADVLGWE